MIDESTSSDTPSWSGLLETSRRFGSYSWLEQRMFQILGGWAGSEADPALAVMFDDHSRRHIWHSNLWHERLPELSNVDAEALVAPPSPEVGAFMDRVAGISNPLERLTVGYELLVTRLAAAYQRESDRLDVVGDASSKRWLGFMLQNLSDELLQSASVLTRALVSDADVDTLTSARNRIERDWLSVGGASVFD